MTSNPGEEVLFSLPLSLVVAVLLLLGLLMAAVGWHLSHRRRAAAHPFTPGGISWLPAMLERLPCGVVLSDAQGRVRLANGQARRWLGHDGSLVRLPLRVAPIVARAVASGESAGLETNGAPAAGQRLWVEATLLGEDDSVLVVVKESGGMHEILMQTIGHELRTPLTAIMGHADILGSCSIAEEDLWRRSRQFITGEVERLAQLVEDLVTLSRLDRAVSALAPVSLRAIAEKAISTTWQSAEDKGVTLALQAAGDLPRVLGDADRLQQVFVNLLDNGVKYTDKGGQVTIRSSAASRPARSRPEQGWD
jgi:signal transduction histidine kinase